VDGSTRASSGPQGARGQRGTGLVGSVAGVTVFLSLLTVAVQILVGLYQTSVVTAVGYDAARRVAVDSDVAPSEAELRAATEQARELLGTVGDDAELVWDVDEAAGVVRLRLVVPTRRFLMPAVAGVLGLDRVDRTVTVRLEANRE
jgi:hypothetical protein